MCWVLVRDPTLGRGYIEGDTPQVEAVRPGYPSAVDLVTLRAVYSRGREAAPEADSGIVQGTRTPYHALKRPRSWGDAALRAERMAVTFRETETRPRSRGLRMRWL